jgi:hypothetical protein
VTIQETIAGLIADARAEKWRLQSSPFFVDGEDGTLWFDDSPEPDALSETEWERLHNTTVDRIKWLESLQGLSDADVVKAFLSQS